MEVMAVVEWRMHDRKELRVVQYAGFQDQKPKKNVASGCIYHFKLNCKITSSWFSAAMGGLCSWRFKQFSYVEPIVFVYCHWLFLIFPLMNQYLYYRISEEIGFPYLNLTSEEGGCSQAQFGENSTFKELEIEVQTKSANLFTYYMIFCTFPAIIISSFMGSYSDKKGRKVALIASLMGAFLETTLLLFVIHLKLHVYVVIAGGVINGVSGYFATLWLGLMSYLGDTVEKSKLSMRMAVLQLFLFLAGTVSQLTSGLWIENLGFKPPMWFMWASLLLIILYTICFVKETVNPKENVKVPFFSMESIKRNYSIFTKRRPGGRKNIILLVVFIAINILATVGTSAVQLLFLLRSPLCWGPRVLGYFLAYRFITLGLGSVAGIAILQKCWSEMNITRIGFLTQIAGLMLLAFSDKTWMVFIVPVISILGSVIEPVFSSILSRLVSSEEQGVLFAIVGIISALGELVGSVLFNSIYPLSLRFNFPGFVFVFAAGISFCQIFMTRCVDVPPDLNKADEKTEGNKKPYTSPDEEECSTHL